jgi:FkbM family methyltransferase
MKEPLLAKLSRLYASGILYSAFQALRYRLRLPSYFRRRFDVNSSSILLYGRRNTSDGYVYEQVIENEEYLQFSRFPDAMSIIDAGANVGYSSVYLARMFPSAKIVAVEPDRNNFDLLCKNVKSLSNVTPVQGAIWNENTMISMSAQEFGDGLDWSKSVSAADGDVFAYSISDIVLSNSLKGPLLVKMDIEGAETVVFRDGDNDWLSSTKAIILELHSDSQFGDPTALVFETMKLHGFEHVQTNEGHMFYKEDN